MRQRYAVAALAAVLASPVSPASAENRLVVSAGYAYAPPASIKPGDTLDLLNADPVPHNIFSDGIDRKGNPLFFSDTINAGQRAPVKGVEKLKPGSYGYFCSVHPNMRGTLQVGATTAIVPTPTGATVPSPTAITLFQDSLYVTSYAAGTVTRLPVLPGGALGPATVYATGFTSPLGVAFAPDGTMFVADSHSGDGGTVGRVWALKPGGGAAGTVGEVVVDGLPNGRHNTNNLTVHNGRLYVTNGNSTDDGVAGGPPERPLSGTLLSVPLNARKLAPKAGRQLTVEAYGMRNVYDVAFRPGTSEAWMPSNGPDALDPYGEDLLHMADVRGAAPDMGFPACVYARSATGAPTFKQNPAIPTKCNPRHRRPEALLGLHVSANGLAFGPQEPGWNGDLFIALFGNNPGETNAGHKIIRVPILGGKAGTPEDVVAAPSPLDLAFGPPGTGMYVADFVTGSITLLRAVTA